MAPFVGSLQKQDAEKRILNGKWQMENGKPNTFLPFPISLRPSLSAVCKGPSLHQLMACQAEVPARPAGEGWPDSCAARDH
jgi:hypothetical protein